MVWNAWSCENADMQTLCMKSFSRVILQEKDFLCYITILFTFIYLFIYLFFTFLLYISLIYYVD